MATTSKKSSKKRSKKTGKKPAKTYFNKTKYKVIKKRAIKRNKRSKVINVKNDVEFFNKISRKQRLTRKQRRIVRRRFREGYSPFEHIIKLQQQLTKTTNVNKYKYKWTCMFQLNDLQTIFKHYPVVGNAPGSTLADATAYVKSEEQSVYLSKLIYEAEVYNPTNYDMTLDIYDIVYKEDSEGKPATRYWEDSSTNDLVSGEQDPITLIKLGTEGLVDGTYTQIADTTAIGFDEIGYHPTKSYPFNIYCRVVKKQTFRLQPGATMQHKFIWSPNALFNLGYLYKYQQQLNNDIGIALKNVTAGVLYRICGQVANTGVDANRNEVITLAPKIAVKEKMVHKYYCMDQRYKYIFNTDLQWTPTNDQTKAMEIVNDEDIKVNQETNLTSTDNNNTTQQAI